MLTLTRAQIIDMGLDMAGRPDLITQARLWLNLFLEEQYMNQDFDWLIKTATLATVEGLAFPTDYRAARSATIDGKSDLIILGNAAEYQTKKRNTSTTNTPHAVFPDHDTRTFHFIPLPSGAVTWELKYYSVPALPTHTDNTADNQVVKWGLPAQILIDHIKGMAQDYNDDERANATKQENIGRLAVAKTNNHDRRAGKSQIPMGKSFRKRF